MEPYAATVIPAWQGCVIVQSCKPSSRMPEDLLRQVTQLLNT
jgi:hypothetical protein